MIQILTWSTLFWFCLSSSGMTCNLYEMDRPFQSRCQIYLQYIDYLNKQDNKSTKLTVPEQTNMSLHNPSTLNVPCQNISGPQSPSQQSTLHLSSTDTFFEKDIITATQYGVRVRKDTLQQSMNYIQKNTLYCTHNSHQTI